MHIHCENRSLIQSLALMRSAIKIVQCLFVQLCSDFTAPLRPTLAMCNLKVTLVCTLYTVLTTIHREEPLLCGSQLPKWIVAYTVAPKTVHSHIHTHSITAYIIVNTLPSLSLKFLHWHFHLVNYNVLWCVSSG